MTATTVDYAITVEHDGRPYDLRLEGLQVPKCGRCGKLVMTEEANQRVTDALREAAHLLLPAQIRQMREDRGLTQKQLASYLQVADATLSRWETGAQIQQRSLDRFMRLFFAVPEVRHFLDEATAARPNKQEHRKAAIAK